MAVLYSIRMRIPRPLELLSDLENEVVFFTDVFKHGLRLPLRHSVQKILAQIDYALGQFILTYGQFSHLYSVMRAKSADQEGWVESNSLSAGQCRHFIVEVSSSQKTWRRHRVLVSGSWESAPGVIVERHIPTTFQTIVSLKRPTASKWEIEAIERVRSKIAEEYRFFKNLLGFVNLFKAGYEEVARVVSSLEEEGWPSEAEDKATTSGRRGFGGAGDCGRAPQGEKDGRSLGRHGGLPLSHREKAAILILDDEAEGDAEPVNVVCPRKVMPFVNYMIDRAGMKLSELEQLPTKTMREQAGRSFRLQAAISILFADMEMWLYMKRAIGVAERHQKKADESRAKLAEAGKIIQDADRRADENTAKIAELFSKLAKAKKAVVDA
ncbi:unnamed protein product [Prunus armeniaca]